jgi:hypothetical protein
MTKRKVMKDQDRMAVKPPVKRAIQIKESLPSDPKECLAAAERYTDKHLGVLAKEILVWHKTGRLPGKHMRQLARFFTFNVPHQLSMAEAMVNRHALAFAAEETEG